MVKVILTADKTLMSEYNKHVFIGFAACAPKLLPDFLYTKIFCPPVEENNGRVKYGHCGQRKIEAALLNSGLSENEVAVVRPDKIKKFIDEETKVIGITTHDPLGLGPASTTFSDLTGREPFTSFYFEKLINDPAIKKHRNQLKIIVGGSGAWQLADERIVAKLGIDCVVLGEGEITGVEVIKKALNDEKLPSFVQGEVVPLDQIPTIKKPTLNGIIEISRGCGRGCRFCNPTMLNFRCIPIERIIEEAKINVDAGNGVLFHAEDVLRYKTKGFVPNEEEVLKLFSEVRKLTTHIGISHFAHASVVAKPSLIEKISELMEVGSKECPFISGQVGIETGSPRLAGKYMVGKAKPFKPEEWPKVVIESHRILSENKWVPCNTLIIGMPGETKEDLRKTIELVEDIGEFKSLIVPLYFVPIGNLKEERFFRTKDMKPEHWQLLAKCMKHNFKWIDILADENLGSVKMSAWKRWAIKKVIKILVNRLNPYIKMMDEGINPLRVDTIETKSIRLSYS